MNKREILEELKEQFKETKERLGFKSTFEEINTISYIEDVVLSHGFVSNKFSRQMINGIVEVFYGWVQELYVWLYPSPMDIIHLNESKKLSDEEKKDILNLIDQIMYFVRKTKRIAFEGLIEGEEGKFLDELVEFYKSDFNPFMLKYHRKLEKIWEDEVSKDKLNKNAN